MNDDKRYGYLDLSYGNEYFGLVTSEPAIVAWMVAEAKRVCPNVQITVDKDLLGEPAEAYFRAKHDTPALHRYLRRQVCHQGWEPYAVHGAYHFFRRQINA